MTECSMVVEQRIRRFKALIDNGWIICPHCNKKQFPVANNTQISGLVWQCKMCKKEFEIEIE